MHHLLVTFGICFAVVCCDGGCGKPNDVSYETKAIILETGECYTESPVVPPVTEAHTEVYTTEWVPPVTEAHTESVIETEVMIYYSVNGKIMPFEWQRYLYDRLKYFGIDWFYSTAMCQIYQESNFNQYSDNGRDKGICQFKEIYWAERCSAAGWSGADIWDVYAQLHTYAWMMSECLRTAKYEIGLALSMYYLGVVEWSDIYVGHVSKWFDYLEVVK